MIAYLPEIYPDELVYSWFCRYFVHSGCLSHKAALQELLNKRCNNPSKEFIGQLNPEAKVQIERIYPVDKLVLEHGYQTIYFHPYFPLLVTNCYEIASTLMDMLS